MSSNIYHSLSDLHSGSYDWHIKVRIIRLWRGISSKGLNILLLDDKNDRIHAFIPGNVIDNHEENIEEGKVYEIHNFSVKDYKPDEKFRCINSERQIMFTSYTQLIKMDTDDMMIASNVFDFYDLSDLVDIANDNLYLTDVVGVIQTDIPMAKLINRFGQAQTQVKFTIVDGRSSINVTFWDSLAEEFSIAKRNIQEHPAIVIIASAKITSWQGSHQSTPQIEISNVTATKFYLNYDHLNVHHLRKMIYTPFFANNDFTSQIPEMFETLSIADIKSLDRAYIQKEFVCEVMIKKVFDHNWRIFECSACYKEIEPVAGEFKCYRCADRNVPNPYQKWYLTIEAEDESGSFQVVLLDREARTVLGMNVSDFDTKTDQACPQIVRELENKFYTLKLQITRENIENQSSTYMATGIFRTVMNENNSNLHEITTQECMQESMTQESLSSYHLDDFSQLTFKSPEISKKKKKYVKKKSK